MITWSSFYRWTTTTRKGKNKKTKRCELRCSKLHWVVFICIKYPNAPGGFKHFHASVFTYWSILLISTVCFFPDYLQPEQCWRPSSISWKFLFPCYTPFVVYAYEKKCVAEPPNSVNLACKPQAFYQIHAFCLLLVSYCPFMTQYLYST